MQPPLPALRVHITSFLAACLPIALILGGVSPALGQTLTHSVPGAIAPGKTTEIALHGTKLDGPIRVWTSFPAQVEIVPNSPKGRTQVLCKVTLAADVPVGVGGIVVSTIHGASDPLLVMVDDLPSLAEGGKNNDPNSPQEFAFPAAIDGRSSGAAFDYYRFAAKAGQRVSIEVVAARLGSDLDPVLRLLDAAGREVQTIDDDDGLGADCRLSHTFSTDGQYTLEVRDNAYKANGRYRLRVGDFPIVSTPFPLGVRQGSTMAVGTAGPLVDPAFSTIVQAPTLSSANRLPFSAKLPGSQASGFALLATSTLPEVVEDTTLEKPSDAAPVVLPAGISGRLEVPADRDHFQFAAVQGTQLSIEAVTRSLGSPTLLVMRLHRVEANGSLGPQLAESGAGGGEEEALTYVTPATGFYQLSVEDLLGRGGPEFTYRIEARSGPSFDLIYQLDKVAKAKTAKTKLALPSNGGAFLLDVQCKRSGYDGPVELSLDTPRTGWQLMNNTIPAKAAEARIYIVAPPDLAPAEYVPLRVIGRAADGSCSHVATMSTLAQLRIARPTLPYPPAWQDGLVQVSGTADEPAFYTLKADKAVVSFPRLVGQTKLTLTMQRTNGKFKDVPLTVLPLDLPPGMTAEVKRNGNGPQETYDILLKGPKDLSDAPRSFRYFAYAELAGAGRAIVSQPIEIQAITPLAVTIAAEPLIAGQKSKAKIALIRSGDDRQPVEVKIKKLPAGVTGPDKITLAAEQNELEIELAATADAAVGKFAELAVSATSKYSGQDISVESPATSLEVKAP